MSFRQIFDRINSYSRVPAFDGFSWSRDEELRRAEELIEGERQREHQEADAAGTDAARKADQTRLAYLQAVRVLSVADGTPWEHIVAAYRREIAIHHPDHTTHLSPAEQERSHRRAQELNMAYEFLGRHHGKK